MTTTRITQVFNNFFGTEIEINKLKNGLLVRKKATRVPLGYFQIATKPPFSFLNSWNYISREFPSVKIYCIHPESLEIILWGEDCSYPTEANESVLEVGAEPVRVLPTANTVFPVWVSKWEKEGKLRYYVNGHKNANGMQANLYTIFESIPSSTQVKVYAQNGKLYSNTSVAFKKEAEEYILSLINIEKNK